MEGRGGYLNSIVVFHYTFHDHTEGRGRVVDQWELRVGRDNLYLHCLVGASRSERMREGDGLSDSSDWISLWLTRA